MEIAALMAWIICGLLGANLGNLVDASRHCVDSDHFWRAFFVSTIWGIVAGPVLLVIGVVASIYRAGEMSKE